jgi:hypothetical protein
LPHRRRCRRSASAVAPRPWRRLSESELGWQDVRQSVCPWVAPGSTVPVPLLPHPTFHLKTDKQAQCPWLASASASRFFLPARSEKSEGACVRHVQPSRRVFCAAATIALTSGWWWPRCDRIA